MLQCHKAASSPTGSNFALLFQGVVPKDMWTIEARIQISNTLIIGRLTLPVERQLNLIFFY